MITNREVSFNIPNSKYYIQIYYGPKAPRERYMSITLRDDAHCCVATFDTYKGNKTWLEEHFKLITEKLAELKKYHEGLIKEIDNTSNFLPVTFAKILETHKDYP